MTYVVVKFVHVAAVAISFGLFSLRGVWMMLDSPNPRPRWARVVPHLNDTVLLVAGIWLVFELRLALGANPWLTAKLVALPVYIGLGTLALRPGRAKRVRVAAWLAALAVFGYIVAVALTRSATL